MPARILDSHVHFVDPGRPEGVAWPPEVSPLYGEHLPRDLLAASVPGSQITCIAVETSRREADDTWLLKIAADEPIVAGVVLNLQPDLPGFPGRLQVAMHSDKFVGIRLRPIVSYDLTSITLHEGIGQLQQHGKTLEFGAAALVQKRAFRDLAERYWGATWILNHAGHPEKEGPLSDEWIAAMSAIAALPNTYCKLSSDNRIATAWPALLEQLAETFGARRLLYGSNWPVCSTTVEPLAACHEISAFFAGEIDALFHGNAERAYGIPKVAADDISRGYR